ncbi:methyltransferase domain-containing protein [candidate division KSB1 bacterium]|nr:methyltransferase domain-containing protein [candidate division KSB1 bacterium]
MQDIYNLPFKQKQFEHVLCSHTIEHVDFPIRFHRELRRVGKQITYVIPPLWDITAAFNLLEHKHIFLAMRTEYKKLPKFIRMPFVNTIHSLLGQKIKA